MSSRIINPNKNYQEGFLEFCKEKYGKQQFSISEAANLYFKYRYKTNDNWTDPKNITGFVKRQSEIGIDFAFHGKKINPNTKHTNKYYSCKE